MKNYIIKIITIVFAASFIQGVNSKAQVKLVEGKKFIDYELTNHSRSKSLKILEKDFHKVFTKLSSKYLMEGHTISVNVTNLDLAGDMRFNTGLNHQDIRVVKDSHPIKLYFNYKVLAKDGSVVSQGEHKIKEFLHLSSNHNRFKNKGNLAYFMPSLEKWFKDEFEKAS